MRVGHRSALRALLRIATIVSVLGTPLLITTSTAETTKRASRQGDLVGHGGPIRAIVADPSTRRILTGSFDYAMMLWHVDENGTAKSLRRFDDHDSAVSAVAFHPDGKRALSASDDGELHFWDLATGRKLHRFKGHTARILGVAVDTSGHWAATASWDRTLRLWDLERLRPVAVLKGHTGPVNAVAFSRDSNHIVSAGYDGTIRLWQRASGKHLRAAYKHGWGINVLKRLGDTDAYVFGALNGTVAIFDFSENRVVRELQAHEKPVLSLALLAKPGLLATGGGDGRINIYRQGDWKPLESYTNPYGPVWAMAFTDNGARIYFGGLDDYATAWQIVPRKKFEPAPSDFPRRFQVRSAEISLGERQFARKCSVCHTLTPDDANRAGPTLHGLFGRRAGSLPGYPYSKALKSLKFVWTPKTLGKLFELGPHRYTPGSKMPLQRITDARKRLALIEFLKSATAEKSHAK
jgi:cytochrome c